MRIDNDLIAKTLSNAQDLLLSLRNSQGFWEGELSSSALATATAVTALAVADKESHSSHIQRGLEWIFRHQNKDGGWGDTVKSISNISTTALCWSALAHGNVSDINLKNAVTLAEKWLSETAGGLTPEHLTQAISVRYGSDRTFSIPILTMCALSGRLGEGQTAWQHVRQLPFELAVCPHQWFKWLRLPVVSYALPALIAIGLVRHVHRPTYNPLTRMLRNLSRTRTLKILTNIQPQNGGYLEAAPLTSFVVMSLSASGLKAHPVTVKGVEFLIHSQRDEGSWPIDTNLATWVTTLSVNALYQNSGFKKELKFSERENLMNWLLNQQYKKEHTLTHTAPGGWAWTDLVGGVPDADDTAGALLALYHLNPHDARAISAAQKGVAWLLDQKNRNGGIPTFCRGWGTLPFDRSAPDLTAHALRAWCVWLDEMPALLKPRVKSAMRDGIVYLAKIQTKEGAWKPLWFGNQYSPGEENLTYGTARVVIALQSLIERKFSGVGQIQTKGIIWLLLAQNPDGGWGGGERC